MNLNEKELAVIEELENELKDNLSQQNDKDFIFSDLTGLYVDIIDVISKEHGTESLLIYDLAKLLEQRIQLYSSRNAYIMGRETKNKHEDKILSDFLCEVMEQSNMRRLDTRVQDCFDDILLLLGDGSGLATEFTEAYDRVHGVIKNNMIEFIRLGQAAPCE